MINKKLVLLLLMSSLTIAQVNNYTTHNYTPWKVVKASDKDKYIEVISEEGLNPDLFKPICVNDNRMIFKYEMMGLEDTFYDKNVKAVNIKSLNTSIYRAVIFALKVDVEEDNPLEGNLNEQYNKICSENKSQRFFTTNHSNSGIDSHGVIKYIGDITVKPPF